MPKPYSGDLRERVLLTCERGKLSRATIAAMFQIAESTVYRWLETWRTEQRRAAKPHAGGPEPRLDAAALDELKAIVAEANDLSLAEHATKLSARTGVTASGPTVSRALKKLGLLRKKDPAGAGAGSGRYRRRPRGLAGRAGRHRSAAADLPRRERDRHPHDPGLCARRTRRAGRGQGAVGPMGAPDGDRRARAGGRARGHEHRRRDHRPLARAAIKSWPSSSRC
jgi:transposase